MIPTLVVIGLGIIWRTKMIECYKCDVFTNEVGEAECCKFIFCPDCLADHEPLECIKEYVEDGKKAVPRSMVHWLIKQLEEAEV